jgi:hypothetical protein
MSVFLFGCRVRTIAPAITTLPATQTSLPSLVETESALVSTVTSSVIGLEPSVSSYADEVLNSAVTNLFNATSFELSAHNIRAYQIIDTNGETRMVYGEFTTNFTVIRLPTLKVHGSFEYRYDPQADFQKFDSYTFQENGKYINRIDEISGTGDAVEIDPEQIRPFVGDVYQTLVTYFDQAKLVTESEGKAVYVIEHPEWYTLKGAIGFADLGFLHAQENGEQLIRQYVAEHYPNVKPILFTIYVAIDEQLITKVEVNDREFMVSIWAEVDRALIEFGEKPENLTRYEVMDVNRAEYQFNNYNQVQDFEIPD